MGLEAGLHRVVLTVWLEILRCTEFLSKSYFQMYWKA